MSTPGFTNNPNGRPPGKPNKRNQEIQELAKEHGADPALFLIKVMKGDLRSLGYEDRAVIRERNYQRSLDEFEKIKAKSKTPDKLVPPEEPVKLTEDEINELNMVSLDTRREAAKELMPYLYGKRKPVDSDGNDKGDPISDLVNALRPR